MLMMGDRKKMVSLVMGSMKPDYVQRMGERAPREEMRKPERQDDYEYALKDAGRKVMNALERKDVDAFLDYMKELIYMCQESETEHEPMDY